MRNKNNMKVCVPTKNRAGLINTPSTFDGHTVILFVEPQDYDSYVAAYPTLKIVNIEKDNQGIAYVRNYIINYMGKQVFIMADDDIVALTKRDGLREGSNAYKYSQTNPDEVVANMEHLIEDNNATLVGFVQEAYAHFEKDELSINTKFPIQLVMIDGRYLPESVRYDSELRSLEDIDFCIQLRENGQHIVVSPCYCYKQNSKLLSNFFADDSGKRNNLLSQAAEALHTKYVKAGKSHYVTLVHKTKPVHRERKYIRVNYSKLCQS